ncbi:MAG TPA: FeoB small GTPase domain-containing protein, partial [Rhodocyclaceae bacterium]|nr:FeoB small GTPase domain-containing protein [Rhodocyclaceae bacterium]
MTASLAIPERPLLGPLLRGASRPRIALVGLPRTGKSTVFDAASSTEVAQHRLAGSELSYAECRVEIGMEEASLVDLPPLASLHDMAADARAVFKYLLWGDRWPAVASHEGEQPGVSFAPPDVLIQVVDATTLERDLELAQELSLLGRPLVIALNRLDEARAKGLYINVRALSDQLGVPVVPTVAHMGKGIAALFAAALKAAHDKACPLPQPPSPHIIASLRDLNAVLADPAIENAFRVPRSLLLLQLAADS